MILLTAPPPWRFKDDSGVARFDAAKDELRARLAALPDGVPVALIAYDSRPEVVLPRTENRRALPARSTTSPCARWRTTPPAR
ncbi:MAG: VWA domain-containing protein [Verrucomicrobiales bacterium]